MGTKSDTLLSMTKMFLHGTRILLAGPLQTNRKEAPRPPRPILCDQTENRAQENNPINRAVTRYEETEIKALLFYAAQKTGADQSDIALRMMDDLGYVHLDDLNLGDYRLIRAYMWTLLANVA